jgi:hypothetical protein
MSGFRVNLAQCFSQQCDGKLAHAVWQIQGKNREFGIFHIFKISSNDVGFKPVPAMKCLKQRGKKICKYVNSYILLYRKYDNYLPARSPRSEIGQTLRTRQKNCAAQR